MSMLDSASGGRVSLLLATPRKLKEQTERRPDQKVYMADANYIAMEINWLPPKLVVRFGSVAFVLLRQSSCE